MMREYATGIARSDISQNQQQLQITNVLHKVINTEPTKPR